MQIQFHSICSGETEVEYVTDAIRSGNISSDGKYTQLAKKMIRDITRCKDIIMTGSATHALELAAEACGISHGDEVIMPSYAFPSTANSVLLRGAVPVFCNVSSDNLGIDPESIKRLITPRTKAIMPVHYSGVPCNMDSIMEIASRFDLKVIEDAAQGIGSYYNGKHLGSIGDFGVISFHSTKNIGCGEGGALLINSNDDSALKTALSFRDKGTNRAEFLDGKADRYKWISRGSNFSPCEMSMAFLCAQIERLEQVNSSRKELFQFYKNSLVPYVPSKIRMISPGSPNGCSVNHHIFYIVMQSEQDSLMIQGFLKERGIDVRTHFESLHESPMGKSLGYESGDFPFESLLSKTLIRLPLHQGITESDALFVIKSLIHGLEML